MEVIRWKTSDGIRAIRSVDTLQWNDIIHNDTKIKSIYVYRNKTNHNMMKLVLSKKHLENLDLLTAGHSQNLCSIRLQVDR